MIDSKTKHTCLPEDYFVIPDGAPTEWPVDEIDCSIARARAVIALVALLLNDYADRPFNLKLCYADRPFNLKLCNAIWSAQADVAHINKLAHHHNYEAICEAAQRADSGLTATSMLMSVPEGEAKPAAYILRGCLELVSEQFSIIGRLSHLEHEERSKLSA